MVELGLAVARKGLVGCEVDLAAKNGLDNRSGLDGVERAALVPCRAVALPLGAGALVRRGLAEVALGKDCAVVLPLLEVGRAVVDGVARETELGDAVHVAVIGKGNGRHAELDRALDHVVYAGGTVEHGVFGVVVQVNKGHGCSPHLMRSEIASLAWNQILPHGADPNGGARSRHTLFDCGRLPSPADGVRAGPPGPSFGQSWARSEAPLAPPARAEFAGTRRADSDLVGCCLRL